MKGFTTDGRPTYGGTRAEASHDFQFYPDDKEMLFDFDAIILGNVAASEFTPSQWENTVEFVRTRGGGLLMLGGSNSLGNHELSASYINTPIAQCLPVELELGSPPPSMAPRRLGRSTTSSQSIADKGYKLQLTPEGKVETLMALADLPTDNLERWQILPTLKGYSKGETCQSRGTRFGGASNRSERIRQANPYRNA